MKQGGSRQQSAGFTIVEVLLVLAVTGLIFVSAVLVINGRQNQTEFTVAINNVKQQIQQVMNETASGYYPNQNFDCTYAATGSPTVNYSGAGQQGTKSSCVFLGKVMQFGAAGGTADAAQVYPVIGNQRALSVMSAAPYALTNNEIATLNLENGLAVKSMTYSSASGSGNTAGIGFLSGDASGTYATSDGLGDGGYASGSLQFSLYAVKNTTVNTTTSTAMAGAISAHSPSDAPTNLINATQVAICFSSGTTNQSGLITVNSANTISLAIKSSVDCT